MIILRGFLDRLMLLCAAVVGGIVPGFMVQYRQRLGGRLDQARLDLESWQRIADQFFRGDLSKLIQEHLRSADPAFRAEGGAIRSLTETVHRLQSAFDALHGSIFHQFVYLVAHADTGIARATFQDWVPTFSFSIDGLTFAALLALSVWLIFHASWWLLGTAAGRLRDALMRYA